MTSQICIHHLNLRLNLKKGATKMHKQYTAKDLMKKARALALLLSVKHTNYRYKHLDHVVIVEEEDYGNYTSIKVKMEKTNKKEKTKEVVYDYEYL
jgi:transcriptional antiterminator Rof (Rho-off)